MTSHTVVGVWPDIEEVWSHTHMVSIGATRSSDAIRTPTSESSTVSIRAKLGSPFKPVRLKKLRKKRRLSLAMAWRRRGAPVRDCSPAPRVEKREPRRMIHLVGHASSDTVRPATSPNWSSSKKRRMVPPKKSTEVRSGPQVVVKDNHSGDMRIYAPMCCYV